jgi:hypothetical protein
MWQEEPTKFCRIPLNLLLREPLRTIAGFFDFARPDAQLNPAATEHTPH